MEVSGVEVVEINSKRSRYKFRCFITGKIVSNNGKAKYNLKSHLNELGMTKYKYIVKLNNLDEDSLDYCSICGKNRVTVKSDGNILLDPFLDDCCSDSKCRVTKRNRSVHRSLDKVVNDESKRSKLIEKRNETMNKVSPDGETLLQKSHRKRISTMRVVGSDGLTGLQRNGYKAIETMKNTLDSDGISDFDKAMDKAMTKKSLKSKKQYKDTNLYTDSSYEIRWLDSQSDLNDIENTIVINYEDKKYYADFFIKSTNTVVEIKSKYVLYKYTTVDELESKFKSCLSHGYNILFVLDYKEYKIYSLDDLYTLIKSMRR